MLRPLRRYPQRERQASGRRVELRVLRARREVDHAGNSDGPDQADLQPQRWQLADRHMIDDRLEPESMAAMAAFQGGEIRAFLHHAAVLGQRTAVLQKR